MLKLMKIKKTYVESEADKFLKDYGDKNIYISYDKDKDTSKYNNKFDTEEITKSLKKLHNKFINLDKFNEFNKFKDNVEKFEYYKSEKEDGSVSPNQRKMRRYARDLKDNFDLYNLKSDSDTSKKGEGLKILTNNKCLIVCLYYSLKYKQEIILNPLKMKRDKYYTRYIGQKY